MRRGAAFAKTLNNSGKNYYFPFFARLGKWSVYSG